MIERDPEHYPMTRLESLLKKCFLQRPRPDKRILESAELADYIAWMAHSFGGDPAYRLDPRELPHFSGGQLAELGRRLLADPRDENTISALSSGYALQNAERYIVSNRHISVGRMLRYMPAHWHEADYFELYYVFSGECPVYFPNETFTLKPGSALIIAPGITHAASCYEDDQVLVYYMIRSNAFDEVFWNQIPPENLMSSFFRRALSGAQKNSYLHFETNADPDIRELMYQICEESQSERPYAAQLVNSLMTTFFLLVLQRYEGSARLPRSEDFYWKHEFSAILSYIQTHYNHAKLREIAERFHYSERQVIRIVKGCTGQNFGDLITRLRMDKAAALLSGTDLSIEAISEEVGYATLSSFYRAFTASQGCSPAAYRKNTGSLS